MLRLTKILSDNNKKTGIYLWKHLKSEKIYVGSAIDLKNRLLKYYNIDYLKRNKNMYICNALLEHGFGEFSLSILVYIDITDISKEEARKEILEREQHYIDLLKPDYNILLTAGSSLGYKHTKESLTKISKTHLGRRVSAETKAKLSLIMSGENHPLFGKTHSTDTINKISLARLGKTHSDKTKALISKALSGENNPMLGKNHSTETKALLSQINMGKSVLPETKKKLSEIHGTTIYVYSPDKMTLINSFSSARKAAEEFNVSKDTILKYTKDGKLFKEQWILSTSLIN